MTTKPSWYLPSLIPSNSSYYTSHSLQTPKVTSKRLLARKSLRDFSSNILISLYEALLLMLMGEGFTLLKSGNGFMGGGVPSPF